MKDGRFSNAWLRKIGIKFLSSVTQIQINWYYCKNSFSMLQISRRFIFKIHRHYFNTYLTHLFLQEDLWQNSKTGEGKEAMTELKWGHFFQNSLTFSVSTFYNEVSTTFLGHQVTKKDKKKTWKTTQNETWSMQNADGTRARVPNWNDAAFPRIYHPIVLIFGLRFSLRQLQVFRALKAETKHAPCRKFPLKSKKSMF